MRRNTLNMEAWLESFLRGLVQEYERVAQRVLDLGSLLPGGASPLQLAVAQQRCADGAASAGAPRVQPA